MNQSNESIESIKLELKKSNVLPKSGIQCYDYKIEKKCADVIIPTFIEFDRLDYTPLNYTFEIYIANTILTSIPNEIIKDSDIEIKAINGTRLKYKIKIPFDNMLTGKEPFNISGIILVALQFHEVRYCFKTRNNLSNVSIYQQQLRLPQELRFQLSSRRHTQNLTRLFYENTLCNKRTDINYYENENTKGLYIICNKPIFNIKLETGGGIFTMDKNYIETKCLKINSDMLYVPINMETKYSNIYYITVNDVNDITNGACTCMHNEPVCIISECVYKINYEIGMSSNIFAGYKTQYKFDDYTD